MKRSILLLLLILTAAGPVTAAEGIDIELIVRQKPAGLEKYFEIDRDTVTLVENSRLFTFMVNFGLDLVHQRSDSQFVEFTAHLVTIGQRPHSASERFRIEYDLPGRIENIPGKNGSVYQLLLSPRGQVEVDETDCPYSPKEDGGFDFDPSPNFDIYYVKGSLGDFRWNHVKAFLEGDYTLFQEALGLTQTGKLNYYLSPCEMEEVNWDDRFGYMVDPGRNRAFAIYNHDFSAVEAVLTNIVRLLRSWGYAPPFLVEGMAGYFEFINYRSKEASADQLLSPKDILTTSAYYNANPVAAEISASSFVKYIVDQYGIEKFRKLYRDSDDLTLALQFKPVYGIGLDSLEKEWRNYIDTVSLTRAQFDYYANRAAVIMKFEKQMEYLEEMRAYDQTRGDTIATLKTLNTVYYQNGRYYDAIEGYRELIDIAPPDPLYWQVLGNLYMISGEYERAGMMFDTVYTLDSTYVSAKLRQAQLEAIDGDTAKAISMAEEYYVRETSTPAKIEFLLFLGKMYDAPGKSRDSAKAVRSYKDALAWTNDVLSRASHDPSYQLRAGQAFLGINDLENARRYLELAYFTETRTFNLGKILLNLGKLYDLLGERETAKDFYQGVLSNQSALWHQEEARRYLAEPFRD